MKKGFSLVETLLAVFLFAAIVMYSISSFMIGKYTAKLAKERIIVSKLLREEMETVLNTDYAAIDAMAGTSHIEINDGLKIFSADRTLDPPKNMDITMPIYGYKKVYAKIEWNGGILGNQRLCEDAVMYVTKQ